MKFTYTKIKDQIYLEDTDEIEEYGEEFEYEPSDEDLLEEVVNCVYDDYLSCKTELSLNAEFATVTKEFINNFITDFDLLDELAECYENELWGIFEEEALDFYDDYNN